MTHRTTLGRVVYARKPHLWTLRDTLRVVRHAPPARSLEEATQAFQILLEAEIVYLRSIIGFLGWYSFWDVLPLVREAIGKIWTTLVGNTDAPKEAQGGVKLQGGLSLL